MSETAPSPRERVLMITVRADHGGGPEHVFQLTRQLCQSMEVFIACPREEPYWSRYEGLVSSARMLEIPHRSFRLGALRTIARFVREHSVRIIHSHGYGGGIYARLAALLTGRPCFHTQHGVTPAAGASGLVKALSDWLLSSVSTGVVAVSASEADALRPRTFWKARLRVIPNGVEIPPERLNPAIAAQRPWPVVHVTRFVYQKNFELLIAILEELRSAGALEHFRFTLLGDGPDRPGYEQRLRELGLEGAVEFAGAVSNVRAYYLRSACLLSTSRWEGLPLAVLEAMAVGVPALATAVVGNCDAVREEQTGSLFPLDDPAQAARALLALRADPARWQRFSEASRSLAEAEFSDTSMAAKTLAMYRSTLPPP